MSTEILRLKCRVSDIFYKFNICSERCRQTLKIHNQGWGGIVDDFPGGALTVSHSLGGWGPILAKF